MKYNRYELGLLGTFVFMFVLAVFLFAYVMPAKAMGINPTNRYTGGSECHAYNTPTGVIKPVYDYCQNAKGNGAVEPKKRVQERSVSNSGTVESTVETVDKPTRDTPKENKPADSLGNPGNTKGVGHAGENPNGKGTMPLDNAGGNGNGEHGNQGQGGHK